MVNARRAIGLIEILVVIGILALLIALLLAGLKGIRGSALAAKTGTILSTARQGLLLTAAERGGLPQPAEHPFAASKAPRPAFVRADGGAVASAGQAIRGVDLAALPPAEAARLLLPDDRSALREAPLVFAATRAELGVLGASQAQVTAYEQRSLLPGQRSAGPGSVIVGEGGPADNRGSLESFLGGSSYEELLALGAIRSSADPEQEPDLAFAEGRLLRRLGPDARALKWKPGCIRDGHGWLRYDLPGAALYDAFGCEVFYRIEGRQLSLISAGRDGALAIAPGPDGVYDPATSALGERGGDDQDGRTDNVVAGAEHD